MRFILPLLLSMKVSYIVAYTNIDIIQYVILFTNYHSFCVCFLFIIQKIDKKEIETMKLQNKAVQNKVHQSMLESTNNISM